jgi:hypothetical protein
VARQDIHADATYGELTTTDNLTNKPVYDFRLLDEVQGEDNDTYCHGEIIVPPGFESKQNYKNGIHIQMSYLPVFKQLQIRFRKESGNGSLEYVLNPTNNSLWFPVYKGTETEEKIQIHLTEFQELNENGHFNLIIQDGYLAVYSGDETDFEIKAALNQNEVFLLKALAGNLYQHPATGVGLIEFLHGNFENTGLAAKLQQEFENDNMIINNAYMDSETGELYLDVKEKNG